MTGRPWPRPSAAEPTWWAKAVGEDRREGSERRPVSRRPPSSELGDDARSEVVWRKRAPGATLTKVRGR